MSIIKDRLEIKDNKFVTELDIKKFVASVDSKNIKGNIGSDLVMAKLEAFQKEYIIEQTKNAYYMKQIIDSILIEDDTSDDVEYIKEISDNCFNMFMIDGQMISVTERNEEGNFLLKLMLNTMNEQLAETGEMVEPKNNFIKRKLLTPQGDEE